MSLNNQRESKSELENNKVMEALKTLERYDFLNADLIVEY